MEPRRLSEAAVCSGYLQRRFHWCNLICASAGRRSVECGGLCGVDLGAVPRESLYAGPQAGSRLTADTHIFKRGTVCAQVCCVCPIFEAVAARGRLGAR